MNGDSRALEKSHWSTWTVIKISFSFVVFWGGMGEVNGRSITLHACSHTGRHRTPHTHPPTQCLSVGIVLLLVMWRTPVSFIDLCLSITIAWCPWTCIHSLGKRPAQRTVVLSPKSEFMTIQSHELPLHRSLKKKTVAPCLTRILTSDDILLAEFHSNPAPSCCSCTGVNF